MVLACFSLPTSDCRCTEHSLTYAVKKERKNLLKYSTAEIILCANYFFHYLFLSILFILPFDRLLSKPCCALRLTHSHTERGLDKPRRTRYTGPQEVARTPLSLGKDLVADNSFTLNGCYKDTKDSKAAEEMEVLFLLQNRTSETIVSYSKLVLVTCFPRRYRLFSHAVSRHRNPFPGIPCSWPVLSPFDRSFLRHFTRTFSVSNITE